MLEEHQRLSGPFSPFALDDFRRLAKGKMAFARINSVALTTLNGTPELVPALCECLGCRWSGIHSHNSTLDWREDYHNANYTYLLSQVLLSRAL